MSEKKNTILSGIALVCAVLALGLSALTALRSAGAQPEVSGDAAALEQRIEELQMQVDMLNAQLEEAVLGNGLSDWRLNAEAWEDSTGADITMTATAAAYEEGMRANFSVRLNGQEVANEACALEGETFSATVSLEAEDGYSYYCILVKEDGSRQQFALSTPENPVEDIPVYLASSLGAYCNMLVDGWIDTDSQVTLTAAYVQVQLPRLSVHGELTAESAQLVLYRNGEALGTADITLLPGEGRGSYEAVLSDLILELPELGDEDFLDLWLEVTLSNGDVLSNPGASWYNSPDGLYMVVG